MPMFLKKAAWAVDAAARRAVAAEKNLMLPVVLPHSGEARSKGNEGMAKRWEGGHSCDG